MKIIYLLFVLFIPSVTYCQWFIHDTVAIDYTGPDSYDYFSGVSLITDNTYAATWVHDPPGNSTPTEVEIFLTPDDGLTWKRVFETSDYGLSFCNDQFINADTGFVNYGNYYYRSIKKTTDGGNTWQYLSIAHKNLSFISGEKGYGMAENVFIKYENDSLTIGDTIPDVISPYVLFTKYKVGYCVSMVQTSGGLQYHKVLKTIDDGENWSFSFIDTLHTIKGLCAPTESSCFIFCDQGVLYKSNDSGLTWTQFTADSLTSITQLTFLDELNGYIVDSNRLYRTIDGGETWNEQTIPTGLTINSVKMINDSIAYLDTEWWNQNVYHYYIVLKTTNGRTQGIFESKKEQNFLHIYPNPTKSDFTFGVPSDLKGGIISIYDINGKLMLNYQVQNTKPLIDISQLKPGIYMGILRKDKLIQSCKTIKE